MPPRYTTRNILIRLLSTQQAPSAGLMTIERRWVDKHLPDRELLEALAHAYQTIALVVAMAHDKAGTPECDIPSRGSCITASLKGYPLDCMQHWDDKRRLNINLANREEITEFTEIMPFDPAISEPARERYGDIEHGWRPHRTSASNARQEANQRMLIADKSLVTMALFFKDEHLIDSLALDFYDQASKQIAMHRVAERVGHLVVNGMMFVSEVWYGTP